MLGVACGPLSFWAVARDPALPWAWTPPARARHRGLAPVATAASPSFKAGRGGALSSPAPSPSPLTEVA